MQPSGISTHVSLLARLKEQGDATAWAEFDDRYRELLFRFARTRGLQPADADDVTQEVLAAAHEALPEFDYDPARGRFRGWLRTAVVRAVGKRLRPGADALARPGTEPFDEGARAVDPDLDHDFEIEWRHYHLRLATAKVRLEFNARDLAAFEACALEGRAAAEVATALGMSVDSVHQAKSRILRRVREHVAAQVAEEG